MKYNQVKNVYASPFSEYMQVNSTAVEPLKFLKFSHFQAVLASASVTILVTTTTCWNLFKPKAQRIEAGDVFCRIHKRLRGGWGEGDNIMYFVRQVNAVVTAESFDMSEWFADEELY